MIAAMEVAARQSSTDHDVCERPSRLLRLEDDRGTQYF
jgi:hypothetical protein